MKKIIFPVWHSILEDKYVKYSLYKYLGKDIYINLSDNNKEIFNQLSTFSERKKRTNFMNKIIKRECKKYNFTYNNFLYKLMDKDGNIKDKYRDVSKLNIHFLYEPMIMDLSKCNFFKSIGLEMTNKLKRRLEMTFNDYIASKSSKLKDVNETDLEYLKMFENGRN